MARLKKGFLSATFFWRVALLAALLSCVVQLGALWLSGGIETKEALSSGRRLLIPLDGSAIQGNLIVSPEPEKEKAVDAAPVTPEVVASVQLIEPEKAPEPIPDIAESDTGISPKAVVEKSAPVAEVQEVVDVAPLDVSENMATVTPSSTPPAAENLKLTEKTDIGTLPKVAADGTKPWKYYAKPFVAKGKKSMIALVVTGLGKSKRASELAIRLPEEVTLSFSPYVKNLASWLSSARITGHELLLDLPMEPGNYPITDPGPLGLLVAKDQEQNEAKLKKIMAGASSYVGFLTPQDEALSSNTEVFKSLLQVLSGRGLMLVVGKPPHKVETQDLLEKGTATSVIAETLIDEELTEIAIQTRLELLEQASRQRGYAVGIAQGYPITMEQVAKWAATLEEKDVILVPVSAIMKQRYP